MEPPTEIAGDEIDEETGRSGDDDPIPSGFVADSFSQVADRDMDVGGGLQAAADGLHRHCALDWRAPTARARKLRCFSWAGKAPFFSSSGKQLLEDRGAPQLVSLFLEVHGQE
jgi:hypothetical protein